MPQKYHFAIKKAAMDFITASLSISAEREGLCTPHIINTSNQAFTKTVPKKFHKICYLEV